jgi:hypothetical protein
VVPFDLKQAIASASPGTVLEVPKGTWAGGLSLTRAVTLLGSGLAGFDGLGRGPVLTVNAPDAEVIISGFDFTNATAISGAAVLFFEGRLTLKDCRFHRCFAPGHGGGAVYARGATLTVERCTFERNTGRQGGAVLLDQLVEASFKGCSFVENTAVRGGALRLKEGARAVLEDCVLTANQAVGPHASGGGIDLAGTTTRAPSLVLRRCTWSGEGAQLGRAPVAPGTVELVETAPPQ